jgi:hypothetical protein
MQSLFEIAQISDEAFRREMSVHTSMDNTKQVQDAIAELTDDYMDDADVIWDTILDTSFVKGDEFIKTFKAWFTAMDFSNNEKLNNEFRQQQTKAASVFGKSLYQQVKYGIEKRAEWQVLK